MSKSEQGDQKTKKKHQCPMCGYEFGWEEAEGCQECSFIKLCKLVMCPRCHYEFPKV